MNKQVWIRMGYVIGLFCLGYAYHLGHLIWIWALLLSLIYLVLTAIGAYFISFNFFIKSFNHGDRTLPQIALTFDDGPVAQTERILDILKEAKVPATFFCIGDRIAGNEAIVQRMDREGHIVANHSQHHRFWFSMSRDITIATEIESCQKAIQATIGKTPTWFRPPYGVTNPMVAGGIQMAGVQSIGWSLRSYDTTAKDADTLLHKTLSKVRNGDIVLFHDRVPITATILPLWIDGVRAQGINIVPLDTLLNITCYE